MTPVSPAIDNPASGMPTLPAQPLSQNDQFPEVPAMRAFGEAQGPFSNRSGFLCKGKAARRWKFGVRRRGKRAEPGSPALSFTAKQSHAGKRFVVRAGCEPGGGGIRGGGCQEEASACTAGTVRLPEKEWTKSRDAKSLGSEGIRDDKDSDPLCRQI